MFARDSFELWNRKYGFKPKGKGDCMKIKKILNNNAVIAVGFDNEEVVVTGLGLAFKKKAGQMLDEEKIERVFRMESKEVSEKLKALIREIPIEFVQVTEEIVSTAREILKKNLSETIYLTLTDHLNFAVNRNKEGQNLSNPMEWEIRRFYQDEYRVGLKALGIIQSHLGVLLPEAEAASIAMHLVNAEMDEQMPNVVKLIKALQDMLNIVKYHFGLELAEDSLHYQRLVTHLKFFAQRVIAGEKDASADEALFEMVATKYKDAYECAVKIQKYVMEQYHFEVNKAEMTYLIVHIDRVIQTSKEG